MAEDFGKILFSSYLEPKFIRLALSEGILEMNEIMIKEMHRAIAQEPISHADRSQILSGVFLNPQVLLRGLSYKHVSNINSNTLIIHDAENAINADEFADLDLAYSYANAIDEGLSLKQLKTDINLAYAAQQEVKRLFGTMPELNQDGNPLLMEDFVEYIIDHEPLPNYSSEQISAYRDCLQANKKISSFMQCYNELSGMWQSKGPGVSLGIHPALKNDYAAVVRAQSVEEGEIDEVAIFFLVIHELETLPVGRNLAETLELSATPQGNALRQRIAELHAQCVAGALGGIPKLTGKIRSDVDEYRSLIRELKSPNTLSRVTDIAISAFGLFPYIGSLASLVGLGRSIHTAVKDRDMKDRLEKMLWAEYRGRSF